MLRKVLFLLLGVFLLLAVLLLPSLQCNESSSAESRYDKYFRKYSHTYFARALDWKWFKAQAIAESRLNPKATSYVGAKGIMQIMPFTAKEIAKELRIKHFNITDPELNINFGIFYDRKMYSVWKTVHGKERVKFMFGSYNAGLGNILRAQKKAKIRRLPTNQWDSISKVLGEVTGRHSIETITYVRRIDKYHYKLMILPNRKKFLIFVGVSF